MANIVKKHFVALSKLTEELTRTAFLCRQEGQQRRDQQEAQNIGSFQQSFPCPDPGKQALYERLLAGAQEHFQSSFQAKAHVMIDTLQVSLVASTNGSHRHDILL